jgi:hypothetical protein
VHGPAERDHRAFERRVPCCRRRIAVERPATARVRRNRSESDLLLCVSGDDAISVESAMLRRDQNPRVDQRRHGDFGSFGWRRVIAASAFQ